MTVTSRVSGSAAGGATKRVISSAIVDALERVARGALSDTATKRVQTGSLSTVSYGLGAWGNTWGFTWGNTWFTSSPSVSFRVSGMVSQDFIRRVDVNLIGTDALTLMDGVTDLFAMDGTTELRSMT